MAKSAQTDAKRGGAEPASLPESRDFIPRLIRAHNNMVNAFEHICGIHIARWRLLYNLARQGRASQNFLSRSTTMGPAAVTRILADLERKGMILRIPSKEDQRQVIVELTAAGARLVDETAAKRAVFIQTALSGFNDAEVVLLERLLGDLEHNLEAVR